MDGSFSQPSYNSIGDPYVDCKENKVHSIKGQRQFLTSCSKKGQTGADWGDGHRKFSGVAGSYEEKYKEESRYRLENTKKNLTPNGFKFSNPSKKSTSLGDYNGAFSKGYENMPDGTYKARGIAKKFEPSALSKRNIITSPSRRGTYGYGGTLMGGKEIEYFKPGVEPKMKKKIVNDNGTDAPPAFKAVASRLDYFDSQEHVAASKVYTWDSSCTVRAPPAEESMTPKQRAEATMGDTSKQWKPAHTGTMAFDKYPSQLPEPYDERIVNRAMLPSRRNPVKDATKHLPESLRERKAFRPSNGSKSKLTKGTSLVGINKHTV